MSLCQLAGAGRGSARGIGMAVREKETKSRLRDAGEGRGLVEGVTGKAAGSAGVCTTDTCLDSITDSEPLFSSDKNGKKLSPPPRKSSLPLRSAVSVTAPSRPIEAAPFAAPAVTPVILSAGSSRYVCKVRKHVRGLREWIPVLRSRVSQSYFFRCSLATPLPPSSPRSRECRESSKCFDVQLP